MMAYICVCVCVCVCVCLQLRDLRGAAAEGLDLAVAPRDDLDEGQHLDAQAWTGAKGGGIRGAAGGGIGDLGRGSLWHPR